MAIAEMFLWWYSHGWVIFFQKVRASLANIIDFFSMGSLIRTLFQPYRQISAESANADSSLDLKFHMFIDRMISRFVGFFTRLILLILGVAIIVFGGIVSLLLLILWPIVPTLPVLGIILSIAGVTL